MHHRPEIRSKTGRAKLAPRIEPYWDSIDTGLSLGYRKMPSGSQTWIGRFTDCDGRKWKPLGRVSERLDYQEAKEAVKKWWRDLEEGVDSTATTVEAACRAYIENRKIKKSEKAGLRADAKFKRLIYGKDLGKKPLDKVRTEHLEKWLHDLVASGIAKQSANRHWTTLVAALNFAVKRRMVSAARQIEWKNVERYRGVDKRREIVLDLAQRRKLIAAATGDVKDLIEALTHTGCRPSELVDAKRGDFDQINGVLTVCSGKTGERKIPLGAAARKVFERLAKDKLPNAPLLMRTSSKTNSWKGGWHREIRNVVKKAGLPAGTRGREGVTLYTLRHSFITTALQEGISVSAVAKLVGTSAMQIERHYYHLIRDHVLPQLDRLVMA